MNDLNNSKLLIHHGLFDIFFDQKTAYESVTDRLYLLPFMEHQYPLSSRFLVGNLQINGLVIPIWYWEFFWKCWPDHRTSIIYDMNIPWEEEKECYKSFSKASIIFARAGRIHALRNREQESMPLLGVIASRNFNLINIFIGENFVADKILLDKLLDQSPITRQHILNKFGKIPYM